MPVHPHGLLKAWRRDWKIRLIEQSNPHWEDFYLPLLS